MKIEIDQSGKIENTNQLTVIAFSNSKSGSILITAKDKKAIQKIYRELGQPNIFVYKLFAIAVFVLLRSELKNMDQIIIDREYPGFEKLIRQFVCETFERADKKIQKDIIHFHLVGKKSRAHRVAFSAFKRKRADIRLDVKQFRRFAFKNKKTGDRLKLA